jgi:hypothetical protein
MSVLNPQDDMGRGRDIPRGPRARNAPLLASGAVDDAEMNIKATWLCNSTVGAKRTSSSKMIVVNIRSGAR